MCAFSASATVPLSNLEINCRTKKHTIQIDNFHDSYRYKSWNLPKLLSDKPDMEVNKGTFDYEGTGFCRSRIWKFTKGSVQFVIDDGTNCVETEPPVGTVAYVSVLINGVQRSLYFCKKY